MLMAVTTEGTLRIGQIQSAGLRFVVSHVAYGSHGFDPLNPATPLALNPAATALVSEVFRKPVPPGNTVVNMMYTPRGRETTYTTVSGLEFSNVVGEAGLIATVTDAGSTGLAAGYEFLIVQAHLGRIVFSTYDRLSLVFPIEYFPAPIPPVACVYEEPGVTYDSPIVYDCTGGSEDVTYEESGVEYDESGIDYE